MDFNTFVAWVGIVAFVLAVPISVFANIITPKVQLWWAGTAKRRAYFRLLRYEKRLKDIDAYDAHPVDALGDLAIWVCYLLTAVVILFMSVVAAAWLPFASWLSTASPGAFSLSHFPSWSLRFVIVITLINEVGFGILFLFQIAIILDAVKVVTINGRNKRRAEIHAYQKKLLRKYPGLTVDKIVPIPKSPTKPQD